MDRRENQEVKKSGVGIADDRNVAIRVNSVSFPPDVLDFSSLDRVREKIRNQLKKGRFLVLDEKLVSCEEVERVSSFFGVGKLSSVVEVYRDKNGFIYREFLVVNPRHLVSKGWVRILIIFLINIEEGAIKGFKVAGKCKKVSLVLSFPELEGVEVMCVTYSESIYRDVFDFVSERNFMGCFEYERVARPGKLRERVIEIGVSGDDIWVRFFRSGKRNEYGLEFKKKD